MTKHALILIDIQNDYFANGKWPLHKVERAAKNASKVLEKARSKGDMVIHIYHEFSNDDAPFFVSGTTGSEIHKSVLPLDSEFLILKHSVNAFHNTSLKSLLDENEIQELTIVGAMSHMCIDAATRAASDYGYKVTVVEDACASRDLNFNDKTISADDVHAAYMSALDFAYANITDTQTYLNRA